MPKDKLTPKQKKFCDEYLKLGNATQAAKNAGYSEKTAMSKGTDRRQKSIMYHHRSIRSILY